MNTITRSSTVGTYSVGPAPGMRSGRRGTATIELAVLAPVLIVLMLGILEVGRAIMVSQMVTDAAREGARRATIIGGSDTTAKNAVTNYLTQTGVPGVSASNTTVSPSADSASSGTAITVTVTVPYGNVPWLPGAPIWFNDQNLTGTVIMRKQ